ncbi:PREDICTED: mediator of DNA damage checkpoint protein 1 [Habropoda laboriosa]|uniref:mediator of DNA damage checkpoint protein 1 n=1 Tax=Habropoda laboriosa TaxID=597456 RepID=UPI00083CE422|nr:PREDICTED: mediator of DNA damage checkpoint protein 1 [Habropoda laboriosa]
MDIPATQIFDDDDFTPTQKLLHSTPQEGIQVNKLYISFLLTNKYPIKKGVTKVGRHPDCNIVLIDQTVSKIHAEIEANSREASAWICDLNSSNKTKLNNSFLRPRRCYELKDGNVLQFGVVQATYKVCRSMDDSLIPETPSANRQKQQQLIIPGTPDSSLNNSSTLGENVSMIPGTQADKKDSVFQYPTLPAKMSTKSTLRSSIQDSSTDDSTDNSRSFNASRKNSVGEQKLSIHDMETQKSFESYNETNDDIHDIDTQKICLSRKIKTATNSIHEQKVSIHDMETQHEIDIDDIKTPKKITVQGIRPRADSDEDIEKSGISGIKQEKKSTEKENNDVKGNESTSCSNDVDKRGDAAECVGNIQKGSQEWLQLSLTTNFEDETSEFDKSRNLLGSQNLLEDFIDDAQPLDEMRSKSSMVANALRTDDVNEENGNSSTEDENIFEAATQIVKINESPLKGVTQRVNYSFKTSFVANDSDETDEEGVFQSYSRKESQNQVSDSEGSNTDEEGRFTEIALKQKRASCSFELRHNKSKEFKNDCNSTTESDDPFDALTQPVNIKNENPSTEQNKEDIINDDSDMETNEDRETEESIDVAPTQVLPSAKPSIMESRPPINVTKNKTGSDEEDITEMEDNTPTQIISPQEKALDTGKDESPIPLHPLNPNPVIECSVEDVDYETAPTQLICENDVRKSLSTRGTSKSRKSKLSNKVSLNDTLEKNMNAIFQDVSEESIEEQPQMSTQVLENMLQSSQSEDKLSTRSDKSNVDNKSPSNKEAEKSKEAKLRNVSLIDSASSSIPRKKSHRFILDTDIGSQNTENYFSTLTSPRKRNVLTDSQASVDLVEHTSNKEKEKEETSESVSIVNEKNSNISKTPSRSVSENLSTPRSAPRELSTPKSSFKKMSTPKSSSKEMSTPKSSSKKMSTPKSLRKNKNEESNIPKVLIEKLNASMSNKDELDECSKKMDNQATDSEHHLQLSKILDDDDDLLAGLPEVRISGTLSNPPSPDLSSSEYRININNNRSTQVSIKIAPKNRRVLQKLSRRTLSNRNANDEPYDIVSKSDSSTICGSSSNSFSNNLDVNKVTVRKNKDEQVNKKSTRLSKVTMPEASRRSAEKDFLPQSKPVVSIVSQEKKKQSQSTQNNKRTHNSRKSENVDHSSIFQVGKEAPVEKATAESTKIKVSNVSRIGKRSLSMMDTVESNILKKRKEDLEADAPLTTRSKKKNAITIRRQSANILDFVTKRSSPFDMNSSSNRSTPDELSLGKQIMVKLVRMSSYALTGSTPPSTSTEWMIENNSNNKTKQSRHMNAANGKTVSNTSIKENDKTVRKQGSTDKRITRKIDLQVEDISSQIGEESQEVEMIINGTLRGQSTNLNVEMKKDVKENSKGSTRKSTRKRGNTTVSTNIDTTDSSTTSTIYESDDMRFEMPTLKIKRAKISKNISKTVSSTTNESTEEPKKNTRSTRSTRGHPQSITDSSVKESSADQTTLNNNTSKMNNSKGKRQKQNKGKTRTTKKQKEDIIEETIFSEINSSIESASILSTPNRSRRNMSSSFTTSSPLRIKHKILFTGISNNDYNKLLTKLGASQVEEPTRCSVLVTDKVRRTVKFLCALALSVPIVSIDWLVDSEKAGHFVELENYILKDSAAEAKFGFKLRDSLEKAKDHKFLEGYTIVLTPNVAPPPVPELKSIITSCNGKVLVRPPTSWPQKAVIVSRKEDLINAKKFLKKAPKSVTIQSTEFILTGILRQKLDFTEFKLT